MGRELKRVPLDFDWPQNKVWHGYLNPYHSTKCPDKWRSMLDDGFVAHVEGNAVFL